MEIQYKVAVSISIRSDYDQVLPLRGNQLNVMEPGLYSVDKALHQS